MRNNTCVICSAEFEPREGKLYCSNSCKQKAFADKKHGMAETKEKQEEQREVRKQFEFYFSEHQQYFKKYPDTNLDSFLLFCFFRKNFKGTFHVEQFRKYMETFDSSWWGDFWDTYDTGTVSPARKKYLEFEAKYFGDEVAVSFSEENKSSTQG